MQNYVTSLGIEVTREFRCVTKYTNFSTQLQLASNLPILYPKNQSYLFVHHWSQLHRIEQWMVVTSMPSFNPNFCIASEVNTDENLSPIEVGAYFKSKAELKMALQTLATRNCFEYTSTKSDKSRLTVKCLAEGCPWRLHASKVGVTATGTGGFQIKTIGSDHNCLGIQHLGHHQASAKFVSVRIQGKIRDHSSYRPKEIQQDIRRELGINIPYWTANRAKGEALAEINGSDEDAYHALPKYCEDLRRNNPGSTVILESTPQEDGPHFRRMFVCYSASAIGFVYCRPVLGLDGTHLKTKYKGILLAATGVDANGSLFPLACAVVEAENDENWLWFIGLLRGVIMQHAPELLIPRALTFVSDRQKGLLEGVEIVFPDSPHGYCLRHLYENMYKEFKHPRLKTFLFQAARAINEDDFNKALEEIRGIHPGAVDWLLGHADPEHWAELYFDGRRYTHSTYQ